MTGIYFEFISRTGCHKTAKMKQVFDSDLFFVDSESLPEVVFDVIFVRNHVKAVTPLFLHQFCSGVDMRTRYFSNLIKELE